VSSAWKIFEEGVIQGFAVNCYSLDRVAHRDTNQTVQSCDEKFGRFERTRSNTSPEVANGRFGATKFEKGGLADRPVCIWPVTSPPCTPTVSAAGLSKWPTLAVQYFGYACRVSHFRDPLSDFVFEHA
jgi:hypothetical protein